LGIDFEVSCLFKQASSRVRVQMCFLEISNLLAARMFSFRCKLRARLRSLPKYIRPYCFLFRRVRLGRIGIHLLEPTAKGCAGQSLNYAV